MSHDHLQNLTSRLARATARRDASTSQHEREYRSILVAQAAREVANELAFLGLEEHPDDTLLQEIFA
jgi:hypothetical protein